MSVFERPADSVGDLRIPAADRRKRIQLRDDQKAAVIVGHMFRWPFVLRAIVRAVGGLFFGSSASTYNWFGPAEDWRRAVASMHNHRTRGCLCDKQDRLLRDRLTRP